MCHCCTGDGNASSVALVIVTSSGFATIQLSSSGGQKVVVVVLVSVGLSSITEPTFPYPSVWNVSVRVLTLMGLCGVGVPKGSGGSTWVTESVVCRCCRAG